VVSGVDVTLRILKTSVSTKTDLITLDKLGYTPPQVELLELASGSANGGVFVSGVTGSGKTTTLNAILRAIALEGIRKVISIEDPVEYVVPGVSHFSIQRQSQNDSGKNPFLGAMLAFLRMDPDVGMVGEVRDSVSAQIVQAAIQTGHKIFSTVHATSALGIISRLNSQAIALPRDTLCGPEFISALVYQVLVPKNCPACSRPATQVMKPAELAPYADFFDLDIDVLRCASDGGCPVCRVKGLDYNGSLRAGVKGVKVGAEVIVPDEPLLQLLSAGKDIEARNHWRSQRTARFDDADTLGKEAWGHVLYDMSRGLIDPFYFEKIFGRPSLFRQAARIRA
jgi:type II secretory ATPase GspE/PulE/Tfp pilus assembly ATPase PilB-like protein